MSSVNQRSSLYQLVRPTLKYASSVWDPNQRIYELESQIIIWSIYNLCIKLGTILLHFKYLITFKHILLKQDPIINPPIYVSVC